MWVLALLQKNWEILLKNMKIKKCKFFSQNFPSKLINKIISKKGPELSCIYCIKTISVRFGFPHSWSCGTRTVSSRTKFLKKQKSFKNIDFCFHAKKQKNISFCLKTFCSEPEHAKKWFYPAQGYAFFFVFLSTWRGQKSGPPG